CHNGSNFTDGKFHNLGVGWDESLARFADEGRARITGQVQDRGFFKTPTLREVARHPPYMHDGSLATLRDVAEFYNRGGNNNPYRNAPLPRLNLTSTDIDALVEFLRTLNGEGFQDVPPAAFPQ